MSDAIVRDVTPADEDAWKEIFRAYRAFYRLAPDEGVVERVWSWILDPAHETGAVVAELDGRVVGLGDHRWFARPSTGTRGIWLDDLFTRPDVRGRGVGRAIIAELQRRAADAGGSVVRWITAQDNAAAQALYDGVATRTAWVVYDAAPAA